MDSNNLGPSNGEASIDENDWRTQFTSESRQKILNRILKMLEEHTSEVGPENLPQLTAVATKFEEKVYYSAPSQKEYLRRISMKMVNMSKPQSSGEVNSMQSNSSSTNQNPPDAVSQSVHSLMHNEGKSLPVPLTNPSQAQQSLLSHTVPNNIMSAGVQSSGNLVSTLQSVTGLTDNTASNAVGQSCNLQNVSGIPPNSVAQCLPSNILVHAQRQMQGRQHVQQVVAQQHQQPSQNPQHYIYQQQVQNQMLKKRRGNIQPPLLQSHVQQQQQQQNLLQPVQLQTSSSLQSNQYSFQPSQPTLQSTPLPNLLHPHSSSLQVTPSVLRQQHQSILSSQQKQQIIGKQPEETKTQQNQLLGQPNSSMEMQHQQQQKWLHHQQQRQVCQQSDISKFHQQLLGPQQQSIGIRPGVSNIQTNNQSVHIRQAKQTPPKLLSTQGQQSQSPQKQLINQFQSQSPHLQQKMGLEKQQFSIQGDMQQRQTSGVLIQPQNVIEQQKQLLQLTRARADPSSTATNSITQRGHTNIVDGQEEIHQKFKSMGELYVPYLRAYHNKIMTAVVQQWANTPESIRQLNLTKRNVESFLTVFEPSNSSRCSILTKQKVIEQLEAFMNIQSNKIKGGIISSQQHGLQQFQPPGGQLLKSQVSQLKHRDDQMNSLMQPRDIQTSAATIQPTSSMPSLSTHIGVSSAHPNVMSTPPNRHHLQSNSNMLNNLNLKQQQEQKTLQTRHVQQRPSSQQLIQQQDQQLLKQQQQQLPLLQQHNLHRQQKLQQSTQSLVHQMPQVHHMSEMNDLKVKQGMGVASGPFQNSAFHHQQIKTGALFSIPSPQPLQAASPQISQHSSPQIDQQSLLTAVSKTGTPLQSSNSPSIAPSPSTPVSSSPLTGNPEKQTSGVSSLSNAGNICQTPTPISLPQSHLVIDTPGISASPLLAEVTSTDTNQGNASTIMFKQSSATGKPIERLIKVVKSLSSKTLSASVDEIELATSMVDRIAASAAGNGYRASVGVDLVHSHAKWRKWLQQGNAIPLNVLSSDDSVNNSFKRVNDLETSELESTATSRIKRFRIEINHALMKEIREINQQLINTVVDISDKDMKMTAAVGVQGTIVKCTFSTAAPSPGLKLQDVSTQMLPILSMWLLVSSHYPNRSPTFLDKLPVNLSNEYEDLLMKTRSWYSQGLRCQQEPISLCKMVKDWDACARAVVTEYAVQKGGGTFSTSYGGWEIC